MSCMCAGHSSKAGLGQPETQASHLWWRVASFFVSMWHDYIYIYMASLVAQIVNCLPTMQDTQVQSLGWEDLLEKEMVTQSNTLAWKIPWMEEPGRLQSIGSQRVGHDWASLSISFMYTYMKEKKIYILWYTWKNICIFYEPYYGQRWRSGGLNAFLSLVKYSALFRPSLRHPWDDVNFFVNSVDGELGKGYDLSRTHERLLAELGSIKQ